MTHNTKPEEGKEITTHCTCGVPYHLHNTCCGWTNASYIMQPKNEQESEWKRKWEEANPNTRFTVTASISVSNPFTVAFVRDLMSQVSKGVISYSRMVEIMNEKSSQLSPSSTAPQGEEETINAMSNALKMFIENVDRWLETGEPATPEESKLIYETAKAALAKKQP